MKTTLINFYSSFYGHEFARHFRRPTDFQISRIQFTVKTPKELYLHISKNNSFHPCYVSVYNYSTVDNLKRKNKDGIEFDRAYFDFDIDNPRAKNIKKELQDLRSHGLNYKKSQQEKLKLQLREMIKNEQIAERAIDDAKLFAERFKKSFGKYPALFFSGFKGCHAYTFFESVKLVNANGAIKHFAKRVKETYNFKTMDLSVNKAPISTLSRVPYSKHQYTGLNVVPFNITDTYENIIKKSIEAKIEPFNIRDHYTNFHEHMMELDIILDDNQKMQAMENKTINRISAGFSAFPNMDHREFFQQVLGPPAKIFEHYNMYNCPFPNHDDKSPSFQVSKYGYKCYSDNCGKKGNYWQFLKDYNGWNDDKVKEYLKSF